MSVNFPKKFKDAIEKASQDEELQQVLRHNTGAALQRAEEAKQQFSDLSRIKKRASFLRLKILEELDRHLIQFESNFTSRGGKVLWANDEKEACEKILKLLKAHESKICLRGRSKTLDEIGIVPFLEKKDIRVITTDTDSIVAETQGRKQSHMVYPTMSIPMDTAIDSLKEKYFSADSEVDDNTIVKALRSNLSDDIKDVKVAITGANFLASDTGSISITSDEGNILMATAEPNLHIVVAGIDKLIPTVEDLALFWPLVSSFAGGGKISAVNTIFNGPRQQGEPDGPDEMIVVILDNGRSDILAKKRHRRILTCIHCGACQNVCPVYKIIGGDAYQTTYTGPYGIIVTPLMKGFKEYQHLSYASTLCGKCSEACPVDINLHDMILYNRHEAVKEGVDDQTIKKYVRAYKFITLRRKRMNFGSAGLKNSILKMTIKDDWGTRRKMPTIAQKNFNQLYHEKKNQ